MGFYSGIASVNEPSNIDTMDDKVKSAALAAIRSDHRLDYLLSVCTFAIAMTSASLSWLLDSANSVDAFVLGFVCGWISGDSLLAIIKAVADSNFLGVAEFDHNEYLQQTSMYFALRRELNQMYSQSVE